MSAKETEMTSPTTPYTRAMDGVRDAYAVGDIEASKAAHAAKSGGVIAAAKEEHGGFGSDFIKSIVFGGLDGVITTYSTIASVAGGALPIETVIVLGFANLIADGISMGVGDGLSSKAEYDFIMSERAREEWEFANHPEGEKEEMVEILREKGFEEEDARTIINTMATEKHKDFFIDYMMAEELGTEVPDDPWGPAKEGMVTFVSFIAFGIMPLIVYCIMWGAKYTNANGIFGVSAAVTAITLFALGALQGKITRQSILKAGTLMMINGSLAAAAAYAVSFGILQAIGNGTNDCGR